MPSTCQSFSFKFHNLSQASRWENHERCIACILYRTDKKLHQSFENIFCQGHHKALLLRHWSQVWVRILHHSMFIAWPPNSPMISSNSWDNLWLIGWVEVLHPVMHASSYVRCSLKDMGHAICDSSSWSPKQEVMGDCIGSIWTSMRWNKNVLSLLSM